MSADAIHEARLPALNNKLEKFLNICRLHSIVQLMAIAFNGDSSVDFLRKDMKA